MATASERTSSTLPLPIRLLAAPAVVVIALLGLWLFGGVVSNDFAVATVLTVAWFAALGAAAFCVSRRRRELLFPVGGTFLATALIVGGLLTWATFRDKTVDERVVTGRSPSDVERRSTAPAGGGPADNVTLAAGAFSGLAHPTEGRAAVVELSGGGRKLTLADFGTDPGPDLFVYLVAGRDPEDVDDRESLGSLKGNKGAQQYDIPAGVDLARYGTVVIWCRAFSVAFGAAKLRLL
jgi:Electron transfer DM13